MGLALPALSHPLLNLKWSQIGPVVVDLLGVLWVGDAAASGLHACGEVDMPLHLHVVAPRHQLYHLLFLLGFWEWLSLIRLVLWLIDISSRRKVLIMWRFTISNGKTWILFIESRLILTDHSAVTLLGRQRLLRCYRVHRETWLPRS